MRIESADIWAKVRFLIAWVMAVMRRTTNALFTFIYVCP